MDGRDFQAHAEVMRALGRIEGKFDSVFGSLSRLRSDHEAVETRVRVLEGWRWNIVGIATGISSVVTVIISYLVR